MRSYSSCQRIVYGIHIINTENWVYSLHFYNELMSDRELFQCGVETACGLSYDLLGDLRDCDKVLFTECNFISSLLRALSKCTSHN